MKKTTAVSSSNPVANNPQVLGFRAQFDERSPLGEIVRTGTQQMLQAAIDAATASERTHYRQIRTKVGAR